MRIVRVRSTAYERSQIHLRAANYASYLGDTVLTALRGARPDLVLCMTDPPIVGDVGLVVARRFGVPLVVISQDVFPEIAERVKRLEQPLVLGALRGLVALYLRRADRVVAIGDTMKQRLEQKGAPADRVAVIPNWVDTTELTPGPRSNTWSAEHELDDRFVVMHSGNIGHAQDLDTLVRAATFLRDLESLRIVVIGFGARHGEVTRLAQRLEVTSTVQFLPYQPREVLPLSLASGDLHYVGLARGLAGYVVPSRVYGILAAGRPVLVSADRESETVRLVEEARCGVVVPPGRPELVGGRDPRRDRRAGVARRDGGARPCVGRARGRPGGRVRPLPPAHRRAGGAQQLAIERIDVVHQAADGVALEHALPPEPTHLGAPGGIASEDLEPFRHRMRVRPCGRRTPSRGRRSRRGSRRPSSRPPVARLPWPR